MMIEPTTDYLRACAAAKENGMSVCGTFRGDTPIYFLADPEATDEQLRELSFEAQNQRPMSDGERQLLSAALERSPGSFNATTADLTGAHG